MTDEQLIKWLNNERNAYECDKCFYNIGNDNGLPCGQQHCWVVLHVKPELKETE